MTPAPKTKPGEAPIDCINLQNTNAGMLAAVATPADANTSTGSEKVYIGLRPSWDLRNWL